MPSLIHPDQCEEILRRALERGDMEGAHAALLVMAAQDPMRAAGLVDTLRLALRVARGETCVHDGGAG